MNEVLKNEEKKKLRSFLEDYGIYPGIWQKKTISDLYDEMEKGETILSTCDNFRAIVRHIKIALIDVYYENPESGLWKLQETKQVFNDTTERHRNLGTSLSEKLVKGESFLQGAIRGIYEELRIKANQDQTTQIPESIEEYRNSESYPGLLTHYEKSLFKLFLTPKQFTPVGYKEEQETKTTYFARTLPQDYRKQKAEKLFNTLSRINKNKVLFFTDPKNPDTQQTIELYDQNNEYIQTFSDQAFLNYFQENHILPGAIINSKNYYIEEICIDGIPTHLIMNEGRNLIQIKPGEEN